MSMNLIAKESISLEAPIKKVWEALTQPEWIKKYFYGTQAISDWKKGSTLVWKGEWQGKQYEDKGIIEEIEPPRHLRYTYLSSMSGKADAPENYAHVTYELTEDGERTLLTISQDNVENEKSKEHSEQNWGFVLESLRKVLQEELQEMK
jgi:uncharacterized protein YndB with AHSA1/START domain